MADILMPLDLFPSSFDGDYSSHYSEILPSIENEFDKPGTAFEPVVGLYSPSPSPTPSDEPLKGRICIICRPGGRYGRLIVCCIACETSPDPTRSGVVHERPCLRRYLSDQKWRNNGRASCPTCHNEFDAVVLQTTLDPSLFAEYERTTREVLVPNFLRTYCAN